VIETALKLRDLLGAEGLDTWPKVTGGKGIHVMAPLSTR
jgi:bifunctional non-homologous end joining protein LigD